MILVIVYFSKDSNYIDFVNSDDCIRKISSISIRKNANVSETFNFEPMKMNFNVKR